MDYFLTIVQVLTLGALVVYVWKTWEMASATRSSVEEMRAARLAESRPYVLLFAEMNSVDPFFFDLVLRNFGKTGARDVSVTIDPPLQASWDGPLKCAFLSRPVGFLAPGAELRTHFDSSAGYFGKNLPGHYTVEVGYKDERGRASYAENLVLNVDQFRGLSWLGRKDLGDIHKALEALRKNAEKTNENLTSVAESLRRGLLTIPASTDGGSEGLRMALSGIEGATKSYAEVSNQQERWPVAKDLQRLAAWHRQLLPLLRGRAAQDQAMDTEWRDFFQALNEVADFRWYMGSLESFDPRVAGLREQAQKMLATPS